MVLVVRVFLAVVLVVMAALKVSHAAVHKVGDSAGWTTIGGVDYKKWAAAKTFHVGDVISEFLSQFSPQVFSVLLLYILIFLHLVSHKTVLSSI